MFSVFGATVIQWPWCSRISKPSFSVYHFADFLASDTTRAMVESRIAAGIGSDSIKAPQGQERSSDIRVLFLRMVPSRRLEIAESLVAQYRKRYGRSLVGMGVFGSVGRGDDRTGSDIDMLVVTREMAQRNSSGSVEHPKSRIIDGIAVTFLQWTTKQAREEVMGSRKDLNGALAGWRSLRPLYDPENFLAMLRRRSFHPTPAQWRGATRQALLETFEDLGKLRNAVESEDLDELREMVIWYTDGAMGCLFDLERFVLSTGRRAFIEALRFGSTGRAIRQLRYGNESPGVASRLAETIWSDLIRRARRKGIRMPPLLSRAPFSDSPRVSRMSVAEQIVRRVRPATTRSGSIQKTVGSNVPASGPQEPPGSLRVSREAGKGRASEGPGRDPRDGDLVFRQHDAGVPLPGASRRRDGPKAPRRDAGPGTTRTEDLSAPDRIL